MNLDYYSLQCINVKNNNYYYINNNVEALSHKS